MLKEYEVLSQFKEGKDVWLIKDLSDGRLYIRKNIIKYDLSIYERLLRLQLPGMPRIISYEEKNGVLTVIEEYINGRTVDELLRENGPFSPEDTREIMMALCTLLNDLHSQDPPMIHRDIKPSNIMIGQNHEVWLLDFNAVKEFRSYTNRDTRLMGTPDFAAPEQYGFGQSDARTDIYGLGVTMNVMLTGELPSEVMAGGPEREIIERCTRLEPAYRYGNVQELYEALNALSGNAPQSRKTAAQDRLYAYEDALSERNRGEDRTKKSFLPVGFRSGKITHIIPAVLGYAFILWMCIDIDWTSSTGGTGGWLNQFLSGAIWFIMCVFTVNWFGNYRNIRSRFFGCRGNGVKNRIASVLWCLVLDAVILFIGAVFLVLFRL